MYYSILCDTGCHKFVCQYGELENVQSSVKSYSSLNYGKSSDYSEISEILCRNKLKFWKLDDDLFDEVTENTRTIVFLLSEFLFNLKVFV